MHTSSDLTLKKHAKKAQAKCLGVANVYLQISINASAGGPWIAGPTIVTYGASRSGNERMWRQQTTSNRPDHTYSPPRAGGSPVGVGVRVGRTEAWFGPN